MVKIIAMTKKSRATTKLIDTPLAARFFTHAINVDYLTPFVVGEKSLAETAQELNISKNRMNYWVNKLLELNLIYTVRVEKRGRHRVCIYRATADVFVVPVELLPTDSDEDIFQLATFEQKVKHSLADFKNTYMKDWQLRYQLLNGTASLKIEPPENRREELKVVNSWGQLNLSEQQAEAFRRDLERVLERYAKQAHNNQGKSFLYKIILVEEGLE
jgi:DNA-binding transcriptional regulator GbsR (MarR family)